MRDELCIQRLGGVAVQDAGRFAGEGQIRGGGRRGWQGEEDGWEKG